MVAASPTPKITSPDGLISASAYGGFTSIAPATWIEIYGTDLATVVSQTWTGSDFNGVNAPTALGGTKGDRAAVARANRAHRAVAGAGASSRARFRLRWC